MSASMAEVLEGHQLNVNTSHGDAWQPPEESATCSCGVDIGGWAASGTDWEWPDGWGKEHGEHVAEKLAANGYGKLEDAWDAGQKSGMRHADRVIAAAKIGRPELPGPPSPNPYRRPE